MISRPSSAVWPVRLWLDQFFLLVNHSQQKVYSTRKASSNDSLMCEEAFNTTILYKISNIRIIKDNLLGLTIGHTRIYKLSDMHRYVIKLIRYLILYISVSHYIGYQISYMWYNIYYLILQVRYLI